MDGIQKHDEIQKQQSVQDQCKSKPCNDHQSMVVDSGPHDVGKGDPSDRNSDSSMVDSVHIFDITPNNVIGTIGQKEFWRVWKAILSLRVMGGLCILHIMFLQILMPL